ncbi:MAG TPA: hypothetical protein VH280_14485 [Verrucomicrobiae bacterium]|nr:hypothetical protein [Verrucomicrobiae bacterium]
MNATSKPGPESKITPELVHRVSGHVAKGIPIKVALKSEFISYHAYRKHLQRHPELAAIQAAAKVKFLDITIDSICAKPGPTLRWLLERRHSDVFGPNADNESDDPEPANASETPKQTIAGFPEHLLEEARKHAQNPDPKNI